MRKKRRENQDKKVKMLTTVETLKTDNEREKKHKNKERTRKKKEKENERKSKCDG